MKDSLVKFPNNLCILFHCLYKKEFGQPLVNKNLFVDVNELKEFCVKLKNEGYNFCLPETALPDRKNCILTFDDGYKNNMLFLEIAYELEIPFIIFIAPYYISNQLPYIWDLVEYCNLKFHYWKEDYVSFFNNFTHNIDELRKSNLHKPMSLEDISEMKKSKYANFAFHTDIHQPMVKYGEQYFDREFKESKKFFDIYIKNYLNHFAFPNGLYTSKSLLRAIKTYDYIYTIFPGEFKLNEQIIPRFSLINSRYGSLISQVNSKLNWLKVTYMQLKAYQYSNF
ncbi:MAG: polysaccharide deacetylase family protein [Leptospira sp.]|nr:polysaccharide deacetylase family protein [Leptospira sp.]